MDLEVGDCTLSPTEVNVQISSVDRIDCDQPHDREVYAKTAYDDQGSSDYPGDDAMAQFGEAACAEKFTDYVGVSYLDSELYFTYLVPSARSWQDGDRDTLCFALSPGEQLTGTVMGSNR